MTTTVEIDGKQLTDALANISVQEQERRLMCRSVDLVCFVRKSTENGKKKRKLESYSCSYFHDLAYDT